MLKHRALILKISLIIVLLIAAFFTKSFTNHEREKANLKPAKKSASVEPTEVLSTKLIGPLRAFANISIWSRAREYEEQGEYFELVSLFSLAKKLQPRNPEIYSYLSNLLINTLSSKFSDEESRWASVSRGLQILEDGMAKLPSSSNLRWNYALFFQNVTGRMPSRTINYALTHENSVFQLSESWKKEAESVLEKIKALDADEKFRFDNFCRDYGHIIIYGSDFKKNPVYLTLSEKLRKLILEVNSTRVRMSFLSYFQSIGEIGYNPMLTMYMVRRAIEVCALNAADVKPVYERLLGVFKDIAKMPPEKLDTDYASAIGDFRRIVDYYNQLYPNG